MTEFHPHVVEGEVTAWFCPGCDAGGALENATAEEGLLILRDAVVAYLARVPKGTALFDLGPLGYIPRLLPESESVIAIQHNFACPECANPFFSASEIIKYFKGMEATFPRSVLDLAVV